LTNTKSVESLRAELLNGTNGTANTTQFDLKKLLGIFGLLVNDLIDILENIRNGKCDE
jgi:hypothetical protein